MCGRYSRSRPSVDYVEPLMSDAGYDEALFRPSYNIAPGTTQPVITTAGPAGQIWGHRPAWAVAKNLAAMINARLDKANGSAWKGLWHHGRVIVPADGWYEWTVENGKKQPFFMRRLDRSPLYFAGLSSQKPGAEPRPGDGFVIVTRDGEGHLAAIHDRRPVVFTADEAREWLDDELDFEGASHLANNLSLTADAFEDFRVSPSVGRVGNDGPEVNAPL